MIILSFYTQPNAVGKSGEVLESIFWSFAAKQRGSILPENWRSPLVQLFRRTLQHCFTAKLQKWNSALSWLYVIVWTAPLQDTQAISGSMILTLTSSLCVFERLRSAVHIKMSRSSWSSVQFGLGVCSAGKPHYSKLFNLKTSGD